MHQVRALKTNIHALSSPQIVPSGKGVAYVDEFRWQRNRGCRAQRD